MTDDPSQPDVQRPRRRRRWPWILLAICVALAAWFSHFAYLRITRRPTPRREYWQAKLAELDPPPEGAVTLAEAKTVLSDQSWLSNLPDAGTSQELEAHCYSVSQGPWDETRRDVIAVGEVFSSAGFADATAKVRSLAESGWRATALEGLEYGFCWRFPREWAPWLAAHSRWTREHKGDPNASVRDWLTALELARHMRRSRSSWPIVFAARVESNVTEEMIWTATEPHPAIDVLTLALEIDEIQGPTLKPTELLAGDRIAFHNLVDGFYVREGGDWLVVSDWTPTRGWTWGGGGGPQASRLWNLASPLFHDLTTARAAVDRYFSQSDRLADLTRCQRLSEPDSDRSGWFNLTVLDGFPTEDAAHLALAVGLYYRSRCELDAAVTMLALAEYDRRLGAYPDRLDQLVPDFLPRLPIDYADMQPLRYRREQDGYVLYSIGGDGEDDGGQHDANDSFWRDSNANLDAVFSAARRPEVTE